jgi:hypothetical protein
MRWLALVAPVAVLSRAVTSFVVVPTRRLRLRNLGKGSKNNLGKNKNPAAALYAREQEEQLTVQIDATLDDAKVTALFAWVSRAFDGDERYNNLMLAIAAVFGNLPTDSAPVVMLQEALELLPANEEELTGEPFSLYERESASMGAMGAAQWTGQFMTRPHALLSLHNLTCIEDWEKTLPRGCRRTLKRAAEQNFTVTVLPIRNNKPAPHSSLAHFRCVVQHEVRLLTYSVNSFLDALAEGVSRYMGTTRMSGEIREYRCTETGKVIAIAHEVRKGKTVRGQWFYATDDASKRYVWFHSVHSLVQRAIESDMVETVDLGPSGSDDFSELKARYGFASVEDWPAVADYIGPFWDYETNQPAKNGVIW